MRGSVAKQIRRVAREQTVGRPAVEYEGHRYAVRLKVGCTRWLHKQLKRQYPKAKRGELK